MLLLQLSWVSPNEHNRSKASSYIMFALIKSRIPSIYQKAMLFILVCVFLLNHSNQNSSQSLATLLLLFSPGLLLFKNEVQLPHGIKLFIAAATSIFLYSLIVFFSHPVSEVSFSTMRGLSFYLLVPVATLILWRSSMSEKYLFFIVLLASFFSLYPVLRELFSDVPHHLRGDLSAHPIFWGNVALTTGVVIFTLSCSEELGVKGKQLLGWIGLAFALTASLWSMTRGGWISIPISLAMFYWLGLVRKSHIIGLFIVIVVLFASSDTLQNRALNTINFLTEDISLDNSTSSRIQMWGIALQTFAEEPIAGSGLDAFYQASTRVHEDKQNWFPYAHAHNEYFEILSSRGLIGLFIFVFMLYALCKIYLENLNSIYAKAGLVSLVQYLIYSWSETFFTTKFTVMYFVILQSILLVFIYKYSSSNRLESSKKSLGVISSE